MTLREADEAAQKGLPVIYDGTVYLRITETGYRYNDKHERIGFVQLLDKCGYSATRADPARCELTKKEEANEGNNNH